MTPDSIPRRKLLGSLAGGGAAIAGLTLSTTRSRTFTETIRLQTGAIDGLLLDWRQTYNDAVLTDTTDGPATPSPTGPEIRFGNVLPGDSGALTVRLRLDDGDGDRVDTENGSSSSNVTAMPELTLDLTGPLSSPGLQEYVDAAVWYDSGLLGIDPFGARNGDRDPGERLVHPEASGPLGDVADALREGVTLDTLPTVPGTSCLGVDDAVTITLGWSFPPNQANINAVQGDTVEFDIQFDATQC